jgi:hypothetical protein
LNIWPNFFSFFFFSLVNEFSHKQFSFNLYSLVILSQFFPINLRLKLHMLIVWTLSKKKKQPKGITNKAHYKGKNLESILI